jgi:hypothetical protein
MFESHHGLVYVMQKEGIKLESDRSVLNIFIS